MQISVEHITKKFGNTAALKDVTLDVRSQELFFLLGPSGCGKTTLLRLLAGFYEPDAGDIHLGDKSMRGVPPHRRNTGMVFQNYALWPHMTVEENVAYGLEVRKVTAAEKQTRVREALEIVQMESYAHRMPNQLSGGQQQRVALARALVIRPDVLLLDEPLSNLDAKLRLEMREEIRRIHAQTKITTVYVTHDQKEALSMAGRIAVLRDGVLEQVGTPRDLYRQPVSRFVADFIGETNWLAGKVLSCTGSKMTVQTDAGVFTASPRTGFEPGARVQVGFRPEAVNVGPGVCNTLATSIAQVTYLGEIEQYELEVSGGWRIKAFEQNPDEVRSTGTPLEVHVRPEDALILPESRNEP